MQGIAFEDYMTDGPLTASDAVREIMGAATVNPIGYCIGGTLLTMICHIPEGQLRIEQEGKTFAAKKNFVWTCNKETKEQAYNDGTVVAIMRITDLKA